MMFGSKTDNLIKLKTLGFNVPDFTVVKFEDAFVEPEKLKKLIDITDKDDKNALKKTIQGFVSKNIKDEFDISLDGSLFAVRSSCSIEDGDKDSFAGQFDTYLNVKKDDLSEKIKECFSSLFNKNVIDYIFQKNVRLDEIKMNVIVQKMVQSELSGIIFSSNPQGLLNESVIVVGRGLGENVVGDKTDTTAYYYNLNDNLYYYEGRENLLSRDMVEKLIDISKQISSNLFEYSDVEFGIANNEIFILQARKITTLDTSNPLILDNSNIVESYPGISLPLTVSFVRLVYAGVFEGVTKRMLKNKVELKKLSDVFKNMVGASNGRVYYKISNWYTLIKYMPFSKKLIPVWQEMLGVKNKSYDENKLSVSAFIKAGVYFNTIKELLLTKKNMEKLSVSFNEMFDLFYGKIDSCKDEKDIYSLFETMQKKVFSCWDITLVNDVYTFIFTGLLKSRLKKKYEDYEQRSNDYISGISNIESMRPVREMINLAAEKSALSKEEYNKRFEEYIHIYGDRSLEELKLESQTFRTCPQLLEKKIEEYSKDNERLSLIKKSVNTASCASLSGEDFITRFFAKKCTVGISNREKSRLDRSNLFGMARTIFIKLGEIYKKQGLIDENDDVFYLTVEEIKNAVTHKTSLKETVAKRKEDYNLFKALPAYTRLIFEKEEFDKHHSSVNNEKYYQNRETLHGIPCSSGVVRGKALVIEDVNGDYDVEDKILVTKMTDPGWVFLLVTAKGVISEKGSLLSHTAIISRELKKPAVVGIEGLLDNIRSGDEIELDANSGTVRVIKRGNEDETR